MDEGIIDETKILLITKGTYQEMIQTSHNMSWSNSFVAIGENPPPHLYINKIPVALNILYLFTEWVPDPCVFLPFRFRDSGIEVSCCNTSYVQVLFL